MKVLVATFKQEKALVQTLRIFVSSCSGHTLRGGHTAAQVGAQWALLITRVTPRAPPRVGAAQDV